MPSEGVLESLVLSDSEFERLSRLVYARFGISLSPQKKTLVMGRLGGILKRRGIRSFDAYCDLIETDRSCRELSELANAISTNHTFFNRERSHFDFLVNTALPEWLAKLRMRGSRDIRLWCAASSSGQEPYTLALILRHVLAREIAQWDAGLLATDISDKALHAARAGRYPRGDLESLPAEWRREHFQPIAGQEDLLEASQQLKRDIVFRRFNLINNEYPFKRPFQIIFCRNVLIYFDPPTKEKVYMNMAKHLEPGGYFFLGHSETMGRGHTGFEYVAPAIYRRT